MSRHLQLARYLSILAFAITAGWVGYSPDDYKAYLALLAAIGTLLKYEHDFAVTLNNKPTDRALFAKLKAALPSDGVMRRVKDQDFGGPFDPKEFRPLWTFMNDWDAPDLEFLDQKLEIQKVELRDYIKEFYGLYAGHVTTNETGTARVDWRYFEEEPYREAIKELNECATDLTDKYNDFIKEARRKLGDS